MNTLRRIVKLGLAVTLALLLAGGFGVGSAVAGPPPEELDEAKVTVMVMPKAAEAGTLAYEITALNRGDFYAKHTTITVPFDPAMLKLVDVKFSGDAGWLKQSEPNTLVIEIPRLGDHHRSTATARFARLPDAPKSASLTERATFAWDGGSGRSNIPQPAVQPYYLLNVSEVAGAEAPTLRFEGNLFAPDELVSFWCNMPDGEIHELLVKNGPGMILEHRVSSKARDDHRYGEYIRADENGSFSITFKEDDLTPGFYSVVAYGHWTDMQAVGEFQVK
jgi:hypothetical protein